MTPLHRALALAEGKHGAVGVGQYLYLNVPGLRHELLEIHGVVAKGALGFAARRLERSRQLLRGRHDAHSLPASARRGFEQNRIAEFLRDLLRFLRVLERFGGSGNDGHSVRHRERARGRLAAHRRDGFGRWTNPDDPGIAHGAGEPLPLGEKSVTGMNRLGAGELRGLDDFVAAQVALARWWRSDENRFVGFSHVRRAHVGLAVNGDRLYAQLLAGADDAQGDLATIRDQYFPKHGGSQWNNLHCQAMDHLLIAPGKCKANSWRESSLHGLTWRTQLKKLGCAALIFTLWSPGRLAGQQFDSVATSSVAPGVVYRKLVVDSTPWRIHVLEVDLKQPGLSLRAVRAGDRFKGFETVRSMARRFTGPGRAVAAINGDFFNVKTGESENNVVVEGSLLKGETLTDSPYDTFNTVHSQFGLGWDNRPVIERFVFTGRAGARGKRAHTLDALNFWPGSNSLVLYTPSFGDSTAIDSSSAPRLSLQLRRQGGTGDTLLFTVMGKPESRRVPLTQGGALVASGTRQSELSQFRPGSTVRAILGLRPSHPPLRTVIGGWPRIVVNGISVAHAVDPLEGTFPRFSAVRHPRTAIGFSRDSSKVFLWPWTGAVSRASGCPSSSLRA